MKNQNKIERVKCVCEDALNQTNELIQRGISNTPLNDKKPDKRIEIDWLSYTFSDIEYDEIDNFYTNSFDLRIKDCKKNSFILNSLLNLMGINKNWKSIEILDRALNGYRFSWLIGENIRLNFAGPKMADDNYSTQILFSGSACREFENFFKASFIELFRFLFNDHKELGYVVDENGEILSAKRLNGSVKRIDIALDDFTGKEQDIYDLKEYAEKHWWIGSYKSVNFYDSSIRNGYVESKGFTMTFGSPGSNQLVIYDKLLERKYHNDLNVNVDLWYRYEMRFVHERANQIASSYVLFFENGELNNFILGLLNRCIEFKSVRNPEINDFSRQYLRTQPTLESWSKFINYTKKVKLDSLNTEHKTIESKIRWMNESLHTTFAEFYLIHKDDPEKFNFEIRKLINKGMHKLNRKQLTAINKYLRENKKQEISEEEYMKIINYGLLKEGEKTYETK